MVWNVDGTGLLLVCIPDVSWTSRWELRPRKQSQAQESILCSHTHPTLCHGLVDRKLSPATTPRPLIASSGGDRL
jgi:hypothetical protein